jgi:hypothetical protein
LQDAGLDERCDGSLRVLGRDVARNRRGVDDRPTDDEISQLLRACPSPRGDLGRPNPGSPTMTSTCRRSRAADNVAVRVTRTPLYSSSSRMTSALAPALSKISPSAR